MKYKIIMDGIADIPEEEISSQLVTIVPLQIITDDIGNQTSACPAPQEYIDVFEKTDAKRIYVVTGSSALSGSYNSAVIACNIFKEENPNKKIRVIDSRNASCGQAVILEKIKEYEAMRAHGETQIPAFSKYIQTVIENIHTRFVLEDLAFLCESGRLSTVKFLIAETLNIVPILENSPKGEICVTGKVRGIKKAIRQLLQEIFKDCEEKYPSHIFISQNNNMETANEICQALQCLLPATEITVLNTGKIASLYSGNKSIIISYTL